jgi:diguanylate cyclase (GGDEF)-like protein/PAS domain S-box-containing protein
MKGESGNNMPMPAPPVDGSEVSIDAAVVLAALPGFVYQLRLDTEGRFRYTWVGSTCETIFGVKPVDVLADADVLLNLIHPADMARVMQSSFEAAAAMEVWRCEFRMVRPDGRELWLESSDTPSRLADGTIVWNGYAEDVTQRKQLEQALKASERRFRSFVENLNDVIYTVDPSGRLSYVSPLWMQRFGLDADSALGRCFDFFLHAEDAASWRSMLDAVISTGVKHDGCEFRLQHADGTWSWNATSAAPVCDEDGQVLYVLGVIHDITQRKRNEQRIRFLAEHDALTGLPNRAHLASRLEDMLDKLPAQGGQLALLFIDLDHFKPVNDQYGHAVGDKLLQAAARRITATLRGSDFVSRIGGDEFIVVLPAASSEQTARIAATKLRDALMQPFTIDGHPLQIGSSIGIALAPHHAQTPEELLQKADAAMYLAKERGRNCSAVWGG